MIWLQQSYNTFRNLMSPNKEVSLYNKTYSSSSIFILVSSGPLHYNPGTHELSAIFLSYRILQDSIRRDKRNMLTQNVLKFLNTRTSALPKCFIYHPLPESLAHHIITWWSHVAITQASSVGVHHQEL